MAAVCRPARATSRFSIEEPVLSSDQQPHHPPLGDGNANAPQLCHQPGTVTCLW